MSFRWHVIQDGELVPVALVNAKAEIEKQLKGHDTSHGFCEDYGCSSLLEIKRALEEPQVVEVKDAEKAEA